MNYTFLTNLPKITKDFLIWTNKYIFSQWTNQNSPHKIAVTTGKLYLNCSLSYFTVCKQNFKDKFILSWLYNMYRCYLGCHGQFPEKNTGPTWNEPVCLSKNPSLIELWKTYFKTTENMRNWEVKHAQADTILSYTFTVWSPLWTFSVANSAIKYQGIFFGQEWMKGDRDRFSYKYLIWAV